jgi:rhodanese-related sulfurtransferase
MSISTISCCILVCGAILLAGCAMRPTTPPNQSWTQPCDTCIAGVKNFAKITPRLWRGSQPTEDGFRHLELAGAKTVIDVRDDSDDYDDFSMLGGTHLKYLRIPMHAWAPDQAQLIVLMKVLERTLKDPDNSPVFVHCSLGEDRTGFSIATYRMVFDGWTPNDAIIEMYDFGFNSIWFRNPTFLKSLDIKKFKALMKLAP